MNVFFSLTIGCFLLFSNVLRAQPKYEFRGAWIATVANIDWPSKKGLSVSEQKQEFIDLINNLQLSGINALIVQVRPVADAFYPSSFEPWSEYLTGKQGQAPSPYYDPLQFMIDAAHARGMEFHAWLNPYRATMNLRSSTTHRDHISREHPEWFITYGDKKYFNPGLPEVMNFVTDVVRDLVTRYDIDAVHMDDYFYPYKIAGKEFNDEAAYRKYGNGLSKDDWRRSNCDSIVRMIHETILNTKPMLRFGISPFGVWRNSSKDPNGSLTRAGVSNYDDLYADILLWLKKGWIDYVAPQLYWEIGHRLCDYNTLVDWWGKNNYGKQVYVGHAMYKGLEKPNAAWSNPDELPDEIKVLRSNPNLNGSIFFSSKSILKNPNGWADSLKNNYYKYPALIPPMHWVDTVAPKAPVITGFNQVVKGTGGYYIAQGIASGEHESEKVKNYVVYVSNSIHSVNDLPQIISAADTTRHFKLIIPNALIDEDWKNCYIAVTCVDKENNESVTSNIIHLKKEKNEWISAR